MDDLAKSYHLLGLKAGASLDEVKQAYRDLVRVWHPDRFGHDERLRLIAQEKLKEINGAYKFLQAHAFEADLAPEEAAAAETADAAAQTDAETASPESPVVSNNRVALWATFIVLTLVAAVATTVLLFQKNRGRTATASAVTKPNPNTDASLRTTTYALNFYRNQGHLAIATTGSLRGTFTIELWTLTRKPRLTQTIVSSRGPDDYGFDIKFRQGKRFHADIGDGSRWLVKDANATYSYTKDAWYHLAYVVTPTNYAAYVNGELTTEHSIYPPGEPLLYDDRHQLRFGMDQLATPDDLEGNLAEIRIWKTARTRAELLANWKTALRGNEPGLQGYWRFAHDIGRETPDRSGHGFTGALMSTASLNTNGPAIAEQ
jgi:hypothetical protein